MSNNTTYASRHTDCGFAMEVISDSLSIYKVSKRGNESLLCIKNSHDEITVTLRHAKLLLESLSRLIEDRTIPARNRSTTSENALTLVESLKGGRHENI